MEQITRAAGKDHRRAGRAARGHHETFSKRRLTSRLRTVLFEELEDYPRGSPAYRRPTPRASGPV